MALLVFGIYLFVIVIYWRLGDILKELKKFNRKNK